MGRTDEEIYVTLVVVKRPHGSGGADLDPACWTDLILNGLVPAGAEHRAEVLTRRFTRAAAGRTAPPHPGLVAYGPLPRPKQRRPWAYLALGAICLGTAAYLAQFVLK